MTLYDKITNILLYFKHYIMHVLMLSNTCKATLEAKTFIDKHCKKQKRNV